MNNKIKIENEINCKVATRFRIDEDDSDNNNTKYNPAKVRVSRILVQLTPK